MIRKDHQEGRKQSQGTRDGSKPATRGGRGRGGAPLIASCHVLKRARLGAHALVFCNRVTVGKLTIGLWLEQQTDELVDAKDNETGDFAIRITAPDHIEYHRALKSNYTKGPEDKHTNSTLYECPLIVVRVGRCVRPWPAGKGSLNVFSSWAVNAACQ